MCIFLNYAAESNFPQNRGQINQIFAKKSKSILRRGGKRRVFPAILAVTAKGNWVHTIINPSIELFIRREHVSK